MLIHLLHHLACYNVWKNAPNNYRRNAHGVIRVTFYDANTSSAYTPNYQIQLKPIPVSPVANSNPLMFEIINSWLLIVFYINIFS